MTRNHFIHFCSQCLRDFRSSSEYPEACTRSGSVHWYQIKQYKEGHASTRATE